MGQCLKICEGTFWLKMADSIAILVQILSSGAVWVRNVVYREVFQNHLEYVLPSTQDTSFMDVYFPCSPLTQQSDMDESVFSPVKGSCSQLVEI